MPYAYTNAEEKQAPSMSTSFTFFISEVKSNLSNKKIFTVEEDKFNK